MNRARHPILPALWIAVISRALFAIAIAWSATARAQSADPEALFREAERLEAAGQTDGACEAFAASNQAEPRAGTMIRLGQCRENQGRLASAWASYKESLTRVKDPNKRAIAEAKVKALEPRLSSVTVRVPASSRIAGLQIARDRAVLDPAQWNTAVFVDGGTYTITAFAPGHASWSETVTVAPEAGRASVDVPRVAPIPQPRPALDVAPTATAAPATGLPMQRKLALGVAGAAVVAAGAGVLIGRTAQQLSDDAFALCADPDMPCRRAAEAQQLLDRGHSRATIANVAYGVSGAVLAGAVVLWLTGGAARPEHVQVSGGAGPHAAHIDVAWRF